MTGSLSYSGIRDNHTRGSVARFLKDKIGPGSRLSIVSAYFTIYAYEALAAELGQIHGLRFLFGEPSFITALDPDKTDPKAFKIEDEGLSLAHRLQQKVVARQCADWLRAKAEIPRKLATKAKYREQDARLRDEIVTLLKRDGYETDVADRLANWNPYDQNKAADFFDPEWMFGLQKGFDIVIGNPPYVRQEKIKDLKPLLKKSYHCFTGVADL